MNNKEINDNIVLFEFKREMIGSYPKINHKQILEIIDKTLDLVESLSKTKNNTDIFTMPNYRFNRFGKDCIVKEK